MTVKVNTLPAGALTRAERIEATPEVFVVADPVPLATPLQAPLTVAPLTALPLLSLTVTAAVASVWLFLKVRRLIAMPATWMVLTVACGCAVIVTVVVPVSPALSVTVSVAVYVPGVP